MVDRRKIGAAMVATTLIGLGAAVLALPARAQEGAQMIVAEAQADGSDDIVVVGDSGQGTTLSADSLRDAARAFRRHRTAFAPDARFFFLVQPVAGIDPDDLDLRLRNANPAADGGHDRIELTLDERGMFELPVDIILSGDWSLRTSAPPGALRIRPQILSPGSSLYDRRFGDARLQCRVAIAFARLGLFARAAAGAVGPCDNSAIGLYLRMPRAIGTVSITGWGEPIELSDDRTSFRVPLHEDAISNEARLRIVLQP